MIDEEGHQFSAGDGELHGSVFCQGCGNVNPTSQRQCQYCGHQMPESHSELRQRLERLRRYDELRKHKRSNNIDSPRSPGGLIWIAMLIMFLPEIKTGEASANVRLDAKSNIEKSL